ncbi:DUF3265 domain-containing protein [Vibrio vulnificus]|nr:DUF3265 domain-containing protein [Vibrio vulnificus]ELG4951900.1 DUF3265 domain-containing protein [Vibrio vulnificus]
MVLESQKVSGCLVAYLVSGNLLSKQLKHRWKTSPNKAFKWDSCRVAFFVCGEFCVESGLRKVGSCGIHPLTRRYTNLS